MSKLESGCSTFSRHARSRIMWKSADRVERHRKEQFLSPVFSPSHCHNDEEGQEEYVEYIIPSCTTLAMHIYIYTYIDIYVYL